MYYDFFQYMRFEDSKVLPLIMDGKFHDLPQQKTKHTVPYCYCVGPQFREGVYQVLLVKKAEAEEKESRKFYVVLGKAAQPVFLGQLDYPEATIMRIYGLVKDEGEEAPTSEEIEEAVSETSFNEQEWALDAWNNIWKKQYPTDMRELYIRNGIEQ